MILDKLWGCGQIRSICWVLLQFQSQQLVFEFEECAGRFWCAVWEFLRQFSIHLLSRCLLRVIDALFSVSINAFGALLTSSNSITKNFPLFASKQRWREALWNFCKLWSSILKACDSVGLPSMNTVNAGFQNSHYISWYGVIFVWNLRFLLMHRL